MSWFRNAIANLYGATVTRYCDSALEVTKVNSNFSSQTIRELRALAKERFLWGYYKLRKAELVVLLENTEMQRAARRGHINLVKLCRKRGATAFNEAMVSAAHGGHIDIVPLCQKWGATAFNSAMVWAALGGHIDIVALCQKWGATATAAVARRLNRLVSLSRDSTSVLRNFSSSSIFLSL